MLLVREFFVSYIFFPLAFENVLYPLNLISFWRGVYPPFSFSTLFAPLLTEEPKRTRHGVIRGFSCLLFFLIFPFLSFFFFSFS
ncbi:hypothetical protein V8C42DRAFT_321359 [Trichoderma barbatum]